MGWSYLPFVCCCQRALLLLLEKEDTVRYCNAHYSCSYFRGYDRSSGSGEQREEVVGGVKLLH